MKETGNKKIEDIASSFLSDFQDVDEEQMENSVIYDDEEILDIDSSDDEILEETEDDYSDIFTDF